MAEQKAQNVVKSFQNIQFANMEDKYDVKLAFNSDSGTIILEFMNKTNTKTYSKQFTKQNIDTITARCQLSPPNLSEVIIDQLSSTDFINKFCRIFVFSDTKQATAKYEEFMKSTSVPDAIGIVEYDEGKSNVVGKHVNETNQQFCLLFLLHFSPSKYVHCNYCFVIGEKHLSDVDRFLIKFNEIKAENEELKNKLNATKNEMTQLTQSLNHANNTINTMNQRLQELETKEAEIDLTLVNNWVNYDAGYAKPKAYKIGKFVYLEGLVKGGSQSSTIAVLPQGWKPRQYKIIASSQNSNQACRINISTDGTIYLYGGYPSGWVSLDGIQFLA